MTPEQQDEQRQRTELMLAIPELRATMLDQFLQAFQLIADCIAERTGQPATDLAVRALAGAVSGAALAVMFTLAEDPKGDIATLFDETMEHFERGLGEDI